MGEPSDPKSWEITEFLKKWAWVIDGEPELIESIESTNTGGEREERTLFFVTFELLATLEAFTDHHRHGDNI